MALGDLHPDDLRGRAEGALCGAAVGDALGATVEFMTPGEIRSTYGVLREVLGGGWLGLRPGQVTDDTEMSLCVARSMVERGWELRDIAERFAAWLRSRPIDVGATCRRGIRRFMVEGTLTAPPSPDDGGNGAAMRAAPVALGTLGAPALCDRRAQEQARITHNHPLSDAGCLLVARMVQLGCSGATKTMLRQQAEVFVAEHPAFRFVPYRGLATAYVVDTLQTVLHHFFRTRTFEDCLTATVNQGGDADTTGSIVGAIAGAYYGVDAIPERWILRLDSSLTRELRELAARLLASSPFAQSSDGAEARREAR